MLISRSSCDACLSERCRGVHEVVHSSFQKQLNSYQAMFSLAESLLCIDEHSMQACRYVLGYILQSHRLQHCCMIQAAKRRAPLDCYLCADGL